MNFLMFTLAERDMGRMGILEILTKWGKYVPDVTRNIELPKRHSRVLKLISKIVSSANLNSGIGYWPLWVKPWDASANPNPAMGISLARG